MQQHPVFEKYTRKYLSRKTGYNRGYLSKVYTGKMKLTRPFIQRVSLTLNEPAEELFLLDAASVPSSDPNHK